MSQITVTQTIVVVLLSIALYNFLELNVKIWTTFKRRKGVYFWSFTIATWGIAFNSIGYLLKHMELTTQGNVYSTLILIGWCSMITGQSVVLYSRLHIVMHNAKRLRAVLIMIIVNAIWLHIPVFVLVYGVNSESPGPYQKPYDIYEKIQLSVFVAQEFIISGLYVYETANLLKLENTIGNESTKKVLHHLLCVNVVVILLDFSILGFEFADMYEMQTAWKPLVYSVKLKLEFSILNRLVELTRNARSRSGDCSNARQHARPGGVALGTLTGSGPQPAIAQGATNTNRWEVQVGSMKQDNSALGSSVVKTTEFKIQSHSRRRSDVSMAESGKDILAESAAEDAQRFNMESASSVSSECRDRKLDNTRWS
ncbi:hypothetical protein ACN47E_001640 [Coniothyrium glycines]